MATPNADGPDLSHYQTITGKPIDPNWTLCSHKATEGRTSFDKTFPARWDWMRAQGFKYRGAYHWLRSDSSMAEQAANVVAVVSRAGGLERGDFIQADWETTLNIAPLTARQVVEWCDRVEQAFGRACVIVYSSDWVPQFAAWRALEPDRPLWYANYLTGTGSASGWAECAKWGAAVWQWTSSFVHASIGGRFDMNHVFDFATLDRLTDQLPQPEPPEERAVVYFYRDRRYKNVWLVGPGGAVAVGPAAVQAGTIEGVPMIVDEHEQSLQSVLAISGLRFDDLVPEA